MFIPFANCHFSVNFLLRNFFKIFECIYLYTISILAGNFVCSQFNQKYVIHEYAQSRRKHVTSLNVLKLMKIYALLCLLSRDFITILFVVQWCVVNSSLVSECLKLYCLRVGVLWTLGWDNMSVQTLQLYCNIN